MENRSIYIVFSSTPYRVGKMIRRLTKEEYNHVSVSLDEDLTRMYGFARRYYRTPLYGGFVQESTSRYRFDGKTTQIRLCRLPVTEAQYQRLCDKLTAMYAQREYYLYNHLAVLSAPFRRQIPVKDAYICVEFAVRVLHELGLPVDCRKYYTVGDLEQLLRPYAIYTGPIPDTGAYDETYYSARPLPHPILASLRSVLALFPRLGS